MLWIKSGVCILTQVKYSAGLMSQSFWFIEFKKVLPMVMEGKAQEEIKKRCIEQNIFGNMSMALD